MKVDIYIINMSNEDILSVSKDTILSYLITGTLGLVLTIVGTKITTDDIRKTVENKNGVGIICK